MMDPRTLAKAMEGDRRVPSGPGERFAGFGVMGLPFASGHLLAFRRMTASSLGPSYTTVWHRSPSGEWTFFTDQDPSRSCPRYFGAEVARVVKGEIEVSWEGPYDLSLRMAQARFQWGVRLSRDLRTRGLSFVGRAMPGALWRNDRVLDLMGEVGGTSLGLGKLALRGRAPNGYLFQVAPRRLWRVEATAAILDFEDLGEMASLGVQARLGDFWVPDAGIFAFGEARFRPLPQERVFAVAPGVPEAPEEVTVRKTDWMDETFENDRR